MLTPLPSSTSPQVIDTVPALSPSGVSWSAVFAGAAAAAALSLVLLILGFGLGLSSVSPWSGTGATVATMGVSAIVWLAFTQLAASAIGGYLAGRLRLKWATLHTDEVYFRDTAHGFLAWAVASLATAALLGSTVSGILGATAHAGAQAVSGATTVAVAAAPELAKGSSDLLDYSVDGLFRRDAAHAGTPASASTRAEAVKIFANDIKNGSLPVEDSQYLGSVVAQETGVTAPEGEKRVTDAFAKTQAAIENAKNSAKQAADTARKAAANASLWMFVALMLGAFFASYAAIHGGRRRDLMV